MEIKKNARNADTGQQVPMKVDLKLKLVVRSLLIAREVQNA
jgi:hypothetical protein